MSDSKTEGGFFFILKVRELPAVKLVIADSRSGHC